MAEIIIKDEDLTSLKGQVVIVTGGSSGIGLATVQVLLSAGAHVINADLAPPADASASTLGATFVRTDVSRWSDLTALFKQVKALHGRVDHVFANAGHARGVDFLATELDPATGELREPHMGLMDVNFRGLVNTAVLAIYHMRPEQQQRGPAGGSVVLNGSVMALQRCRAVEYATSKHAVHGFARGMHSAIGDAGLPVRVNTVAPTWAGTGLLPGLPDLLDRAGVPYQPGTAVGRAAAMLMADGARNGHIVEVRSGKYKEIDEALYLPAYEELRGDYPCENESLLKMLQIMAGGEAAA